jgi:hypothetical protein
LVLGLWWVLGSVGWVVGVGVLGWVGGGGLGGLVVGE